MQMVPFSTLGFDVSRLGFGCMRFPTMEQDGNAVIDREKAIAMLRYGIDHGINYVDTAYNYHNMESEIVTGLALKEGYRERVTLTTKLPTWLVNEKEDMDKLLDEQLKKLDVPYVDFYILHALNKNSFQKMQSFGYQAFFERALKDGRIKHPGFSFHDDHATYMKILHDYDFELAQVQYNYLDIDFQAGIKGIKAAGKKGTAIVMMEPLRGGSLANPPQEVQEKIKNHKNGWSPVEWAFRHIADTKEGVTILSGMSNMEQLKDNLSIFGKPDFGACPLGEEELAFLKDLRETYLARVPISCTGCNYCQPCPAQIKIPVLFKQFNEAVMLGHEERFKNNYSTLIKEQGDPEECLQCNQCESVCPQKLPIVQLLSSMGE